MVPKIKLVRMSLQLVNDSQVKKQLCCTEKVILIVFSYMYNVLCVL